MKLALGGAQLGMPYGIANKDGMPTLSEATRILEVARSAEIATIDTAAVYGESETVIGRVLGAVSGPWEIVTKLIAEGESAEWTDSLSRSRERLGRAPAALLCHRPADWIENASFRAWLVEQRTSGACRRVGVSVYTPEEARAAARFQPDIVQLPLSALDQRFRCAGILDLLHDRGAEVHVRSVFLQGLLFIELEHLDPRFIERVPALSRLHELAHAENTNAGLLSLAFVAGLSQVDRIVVGVERAEQLVPLVERVQRPLSPSVTAALMALDPPDETAVDPRRWPAAGLRRQVDNQQFRRQAR